MDSLIKWGIIGPGKIAHKFAEDLRLSKTGMLYAVASRDINRSYDFANKFSAYRYYGSYEEIVNDKDIEVIYIASPHSFHFEHSMLALNSGKAVLCEKPSALNRFQLEKILRSASEKKLFYMEAMWTRFIPAFEKVLELIYKGLIGEIYHLSADFGFTGDSDPYNRLWNKKLGGGSLMDIGIYPIYLSQMILGIPKEIKSRATISETGVDSSCEIEFEYKNKAVSLLKSSFLENTPTEATIKGEFGSIKLHSRFHHPERITLIFNDGNRHDYNIPYTGNGYIYEIEEVNNCIRQNLLASPRHDHKTSMELITLLDRVKSSIGLDYSSF